MKCVIAAALVILLIIPSLSFAQQADYSMLDNRPLDLSRDPDIDMYIGSWKQSMPKCTHGSLIERDILTKGDPASPKEPGAVLKFAERFTYAVLSGGSVTTPVTLEGEQEIFYIISGSGEVTSGGETAKLYPGIGVLIPPGVEFSMKNTGEEPLAMYLLAEKTPPGFKALAAMKISDENTAVWGSANPHWVGMSRGLFNKSTGLATIGNIITVILDANTMFHPHSHREGQEEVWTTIMGDSRYLLGKEIRKQPPGTAYYIPPTGYTAHGNINVSDSITKLFYFSHLSD